MRNDTGGLYQQRQRFMASMGLVNPIERQVYA